MSENKKEKSMARVATYLRGGVKNKFLSDVKTKGVSESSMLRDIVSKHYQDKK